MKSKKNKTNHIHSLEIRAIFLYPRCDAKEKKNIYNIWEKSLQNTQGGLFKNKTKQKRRIHKKIF